MTYTIGGRPSRRARGGRLLLLLTCAAGVTLAAAGCAGKPRKQITSPYQNLGPRKNLPPYLKGSVYELVELANNEPLSVSSYGLVGQLRGTGDTKAPPAVRQWVTKEMVRRGFGSKVLGYESMSPGRVLASPDFAVVRVDAELPPGARAGDRIDARVSALPNETSSLAHGVLFETELREDGANPQAPSTAIRAWGKCGGPVMVNPAYALEAGAAQPGPAKASLRRGTLPNGGIIHHDRPLWLMLRQPQHSVSRAIERRINDRFQQEADHPRKDGNPGYLVAQAYDEGIVQFYVPRSFQGDWEHFVGVVTHLYMGGASPDFAARKAKELADEATRPDARLMDISYCWEGLGAPAMPFVSRLMSHQDPDVAFAAARAAAFIGDPSMAAQETLLRMAEKRGHPFQVSAIEVLAKLPASAALSELLRRLLDAPEETVRVAAYEALTKAQDPSVYSRPVKRYEDREKFVIDVVPGDGPPMIYASQRGRPRIGIVGRTPEIRQPLTFTALDKRLSISTTQIPTADGNGQRDALVLFYRDPRGRGPNSTVRVLSRPDVAELAARLAGHGAAGEQRLDFSYGEVVAILQALVARGDITSPRRGPDGRHLAASFVLQRASGIADEIRSAPTINEGRPQGDTPPGPVGMR